MNKGWKMICTATFVLLVMLTTSPTTTSADTNSTITSTAPTTMMCPATMMAPFAPPVAPKPKVATAILINANFIELAGNEEKKASFSRD